MGSQQTSVGSATFVTVVSGSSPEGTTLLLAMLQSGGLQVLCDVAPRDMRPGMHEPYDYSPSLGLGPDPGSSAWLAGASGKVVKVREDQLEHLSPALEYRVIFVGGHATSAGATRAEQDARANRLLVTHGDLEADPAEQAVRVASFLGLPLNVEAMAAAGGDTS